MDPRLPSPSHIIAVILFGVVLSATGNAVCADEPEWPRLDTRFTSIHYQEEGDLEKFYSRIDYGPRHWGIKRLFSSSAPKNVQEAIVKKVDLLFERVQSILGMRKKIDKVNVRLHQDQDQLHRAFYNIYRQKCHIRAWYRYKNNTVYLNLQDLDEGMLAHELAHAIIDHYLLVRPPRATAEILARYVDRHLK